ncbi:hypothetical protein SAMN04489724_2661 [Algoriphagus locisalis]|uniref:Uncharacterized protein n=1 Tax=Algoriphagus locisalis TaxID=305507 RepID=A0A1I7BSG8_9BACT|nr:hypothetical protein [Algoriphagus locisalis]SFT90130.1 hypothetical protein SAMN04489724_2661 [Algoriphagus locisalis]
MAKEKNNLDQFFKEKLENHTETPSKLAWERLESQLPQKSKSYKGIWWAAAASLTLLFTVGYLVMREGDVTVDQPILADNTTEEVITPTPAEITTPEETEKTQNEIENQQAAEELKTKPTTTTKPNAKPADTSSSTQKPLATSPQNLVAMNEVREEPKQESVEKVTAPKIEVETPEFKQAELPPLNLEQTVAEVTEPVEAEPAYRVKIYSDGLKEEPKDKSLIAGIGKTVNEVEGILGKVDQGFADLQDAKNNLFASITSKKTRAED